jgi:hypothetical protein
MSDKNSSSLSLDFGRMQWSELLQVLDRIERVWHMMVTTKFSAKYTCIVT